MGLLSIPWPLSSLPFVLWFSSPLSASAFVSFNVDAAGSQLRLPLTEDGKGPAVERAQLVWKQSCPS